MLFRVSLPAWVGSLAAIEEEMESAGVNPGDAALPCSARTAQATETSAVMQTKRRVKDEI